MISCATALERNSAAIFAVAVGLTGLLQTEQRRVTVLVVSIRNEPSRVGPDPRCEVESGANLGRVEGTLHFRNSMAVDLSHGIKGFEAHSVLYSN